MRARIVVTSRTVTWSEFAQPHRREWDYTGFGPFVFERERYEEAVRQAVAAAGE